MAALVSLGAAAAGGEASRVEETVAAAQPVQDEPPAEALHEAGKRFIQFFPPEVYGGHPRIRQVVQGAGGLIYAACDSGVLQFDGARWQIHRAGSALASLALADDGTIFAGCENDFGYFQADQAGIYRFVSLREQVPPGFGSFGPVDFTIATPDAVYFCAGDRLVRWQGNVASQHPLRLHMYRSRGRSRAAPRPFSWIGAIDGEVYVHETGVGLQQVHGDQLRPLAGLEALRDLRVTDIVKWDATRWLVVTEADGLFLRDEDQLTKLDSPASEFARDYRSTGCTVLSSGGFAVSTRRGGVAVFDRSQHIQSVIHESMGLPPDEVGKVFEDAEGAIWMPIRNGLARAKIAAQLSYFDAGLNIRGRARAVCRHRGSLYLATSRGVYRLVTSGQPGQLPRFRMIAPGTCFDLIVFQNELFAGHGNGLYQITGGLPVKVLPGRCAQLAVSPDGQQLYVVGNRLRRVWRADDDWQFEVVGVSQLLAGNIAVTDDGHLWLTARSGSGQAELLRLAPPLDQGPVAATVYGSRHGLTQRGPLCPFVLGGELYVAGTRGIFRYAAERDGFVVSMPHSSSLAPQLSLGKSIYVDDRDCAWFITHSMQAVCWHPRAGERVLFFPGQCRTVTHFHRVVPERGGTAVWASGTDGRLIRYEADSRAPPPPQVMPHITRVTSQLRGTIFGGAAGGPRRTCQLGFDEDTLRFEFGFPRFDTHPAHEYQYRLVGRDESWSEWTTSTQREFSIPREGAYRFEVRARDDSGASQVASFAFRVLPPWYRTGWAYLLFAVALAGGSLAALRRRVRHSHDALRQLEAAVEVRTANLRETEARLVQARDELEEKVQARTAELQVSEERFRLVTMATRDAVYDHDLASGFVWRNHRYRRRFGGDHYRSELQWWIERLHPDERLAVVAHWQQTLGGNDNYYSADYRFRLPEGDYAHVENRGFIIRDAAGDPLRMIGAISEVTKRKQAEAVLRESEERFRTLCEDSPWGIFLCDVEGHCLYANPRCCEIVGLSFEHLLGQGLADAVHPDDRARISESWRHASQSQQGFSGEHRFLHADGRVVWAQCCAVPRRGSDSRLVGYVGTIADVTERKLAEQALRQSEEQYRALFDNSTSGIILLQLDGTVVAANPAVCQMHGYSREEFVRLDPRQFIHPDSLHLFDEFVATVGRGEVFHCEARDLRRDGSTFDVDVHGQLMTYHGRPHMFAIVRDVSARKHAQDKLNQQEVMLAHATRLSTMGELVAGLAHEVNQPLYAIQNFAKANANLLKNSRPLDTQLLREWNDEITEAARRAGEIIKRLRGFVSRRDPARVPADVNEVVAESVALVSFEARRRKAKISFALEENLPPVWIDRVQVQQVLVNLLKNSFEAMDDAGAHPRQVLIRTRRLEDHVDVSVSDSGPGLPADLLDQLFEPFVTTKSEGMGMGLAISETIIAAHGGELRAGRGQRGGADMHFTLPLVTAGAQRPPRGDHGREPETNVAPASLPDR